MKKIGILTSGGDAPGMNAFTRATVRTAIANDIEVYAIRGGFEGILHEKFTKLNKRSVSNIIQQGGTIIKTARSMDFYKEEVQKKAAGILEKHKFDGIIANGGNGTMKGLFALSKFWSGQIIGVPGTIDNDIYGTDYTIGFDTAINTALDAIDKIRDTASAHERAFIIEVMGRDSGFIALEVALAGGCEGVLLPEYDTDLNELAQKYIKDKNTGKKSNLVVLAEGAIKGKGAAYLKKILEELTNSKWRVVIIGYIQRGGAPTARDRVLATKLGSYAVKCLINNDNDIMVGEINNKLTKTSLREVISKKKDLDDFTFKLFSSHVLD